MKTIYVIEKEILRQDGMYNNENPMKIWCGNGEMKGFSEDYDIVDKKCKELNNSNKLKTVRYMINAVEELE